MDDGPLPDGGNLHKITVNLTEKSWTAANETAASTGMTRTDVINRAIQVYAYLEFEMAKGSKFLVSDKDGEAVKIRFM